MVCINSPISANPPQNATVLNIASSRVVWFPGVRDSKNHPSESRKSPPLCASDAMAMNQSSSHSTPFAENSHLPLQSHCSKRDVHTAPFHIGRILCVSSGSRYHISEPTIQYSGGILIREATAFRSCGEIRPSYIRQAQPQGSDQTRHPQLQGHLSKSRHHRTGEEAQRVE